MTNGLLGAIAAHGLAGARPPPPGTPRPDEAWGPLLIDVGRHRLTGVLVTMVDAGLVDLSEAQRVELSERHESEMVTCLELEAMMLTGIEVLTAAGVAPVVLKGPALAHLIAADPAQRSFGDIDLLVRSDHVARALTALRAKGAERLVPELSPGYDRRFAKSITVGWDRFELDLHRTLADGPCGLERMPNGVSFRLYSRTAISNVACSTSVGTAANPNLAITLIERRSSGHDAFSASSRFHGAPSFSGCRRNPLLPE